MIKKIFDFRSRAYTEQTAAIYEEIKAYMPEYTELHVSDLYHAQTRCECGIIERINYNKLKSEDSKRTQCPEEKKKVIVEALMQFGGFNGICIS